MFRIARFSIFAGCVLSLWLNTFAESADYTRSGTAIVSNQTVQITRGNATQSQTVIYYPAVSKGRQASLDLGQAPYPIVVFTSPVMPMSVYSQTLSHLASWGFIVMAPTDGMELLPDQAAVADDMRLCLNYIEAENRRPQSVFHGTIDTNRIGFCGHSWGGACSIIAAAKEKERVKVVVNLACWSKSTPSAQSCVGHLACPLIMLTGDADSVTPLPTVESIFEAAVPTKALIILQGGTHFGFIDNWLSMPINGVDLHDQQLSITRHYMTVALLVHLKDRADLKPFLWERGAKDFGKVTRMMEMGNASESLLNRDVTAKISTVKR